MHRSSLLLTILVLLASSMNYADEGEWSRFRGPNGTGISEATTVPVRWTEKDYNWKIDLPGPGHSSPVVWDKRIFVTCGDPTTALRTTLCVDAQTGRTLWKHEEPSQTYGQHRDNSYASATPTVDADGVVITWTTPKAVMLLALDLQGRELWRRNLGPLISLQGSGSSPILYQDLVVLANDQEDMERSPGRRKDGPNPAGRSFVVGVDRKSGEIRWQTETKTFLAGYSTPCVYQAEGGRPELIFSNTAHGIMAVDPTTGEVTWEFGQPFLDRAVISPVLAPGLVIAGHGAGIRGTRCIAVRPGSSGQGTVPTLAYAITKSLPMVPTPLVKDGRLFLWGDDGVVSCLRVATGETVWRERVEGGFYASPVWVGGYLYNVSKNGEVVVLAAGDAFEVLHRIPLGESSYATPAVAGGVMTLRTNSHLFSLGGRR
ncbi:MAG: PQQ-like beta-propeller repeat protein [Planctomycetes bacterium]|nr:PQQ-like beta-propeller repeat protein [Planctomycetota bacterium]MBL7039455.1 PQQ-like beta-propeller repeat protein [Pirellulaceae bacterium]